MSLCDFGIPRPTHRPVTVHFSDGTRIHIGIEPLLKVETEVGQIKNGDLKIHKPDPSIVGSPILWRNAPPRFEFQPNTAVPDHSQSTNALCLSA